MSGEGSGTPTRTMLPEKGAAWNELRERMLTFADGDVDWRSARTAVYVFNAG